MGLVTTLAIASLVVAAGSAYMQNKNSIAARKEQRSAAATANAENTAQQQASIRQQVRAQRVKTAQITQASMNTGTAGSSGELGGISVIGSQVGSNIGTMSRNQNSMSSITDSQGRAADFKGQAATWGAVGEIASTSFNIFSNTPQFKQSMANLF